MVRVRALLVPPLSQPRLPEFPLGVLIVTLAVPEAVMSAVVSVACNWDLLRTWVLRVVPLTTTTEDAAQCAIKNSVLGVAQTFHLSRVVRLRHIFIVRKEHVLSQGLMLAGGQFDNH
jgi:hypothetical protein